MNSWFTTTQITVDTYVISEWKHEEETHCYLLLGTTKALLIDTGMGVANIKVEVEALTSLPIQVISTHAHWDHIGGHALFSDILVHEKESTWLTTFPMPLAFVKQQLLKGSTQFPNSFAIEDYTIYQGGATKTVSDHEMINLGNRVIEIIHTPGHAPGHMCFYEAERASLYTGDLVYQGCLFMNYPTTDPIDFYTSIKRIQQLPVQHLYPGHHALNIPATILDDIAHGFEEVKKQHMLQQGSGLFQFSGFDLLL